MSNALNSRKKINDIFTSSDVCLQHAPVASDPVSRCCSLLCKTRARGGRWICAASQSNVCSGYHDIFQTVGWMKKRSFEIFTSVAVIVSTSCTFRFSTVYKAYQKFRAIIHISLRHRSFINRNFMGRYILWRSRLMYIKYFAIADWNHVLKSS